MSISHFSEDRLFGRIVVDLRLATASQVQAALERQDRLLGAGERRRLGVILVEEGVLSPDGVRRALAQQGKSVIVCRTCGRTFQGADRHQPCPGCGGALRDFNLESALGADLRAAGTQVFPAPVTNAPAAGTRLSPSPAAEPPPAGSGQVFGRYRLLEMLGSGGMGVVWKAWDTGLGRFVALKQIRTEKARAKGDRLRFEREARLSAKLRHPHIVAVHDVGEVDGRLYITMDWIQGRTLASALEDPAGGDRDVASALRRWVALLADVAGAAAYAHAEGVIHRDLKPSNVLLDARDQAYVMDFGLGKEVEGAAEGLPRVTVTGEVLGTPAYMSPEQVLGDTARIGPRSDVWALGVMLYQILTGDTPFEAPGRHAFDVMHAVYAFDPTSPRKRRPEVPLELEAICLKALDKDLDRRYRSARDLEEELRRWLRGDPVEARRPSMVGRVWRKARRNKLRLAGVALFATSALLAAYFQWDAGRAREEVLHQLRETARMCVEETLAARRIGFLDPGKRFCARLREAYARAQERLSTPSPEPAFLLGRLLRADLEEDEARTLEDRALAIDPEFAPALYERAVLAAREYQRRLNGARDEALGRLGAELAEAGKTRPGALGAESLRVPRTEELDASDTELNRCKEETVRLLMRLESALDQDPAWGRQLDPLFRVGEAKVACVRGMLAAFRSGGWEDAERLLLGAIRADPGLEEAHEALANAALRGERRERALEACAHGLDADRGYLPHWLNRGAAGLEDALAQACRGVDATERFSGAVADFGKALELDPGLVEAWEGRGHARLQWAVFRKNRGEDPRDLYAGAIADLGSALALRPDHARSYLRRGCVYMNRGLYLKKRGEDPGADYAAAVADCDRALALAPQAAEAWRDRGLARMNAATWERSRGKDPSAEYADAIADFDRALAQNPTDAEAWRDRGAARLNWGIDGMGRDRDPSELLAAAVADFATAARLRPADGKAVANRGIAYMTWGTYRMGRGLDPTGPYASAAAQFDRAIELNPSDAEAFKNRGMVRNNRAEWTEAQGGDAAELRAGAIADFEASLAKNPDQPQVRDYLAQARAAAKK